MALQGFVDEISRGRVAGWCYDPSRPGGALQLELVVDGTILKCMLADRMRPDVDAHLGLQPGSAKGFEYDLDPPLSVFRGHQIEIRTAVDQVVLSDGKLTLKPRRHGQLRPILVNSVGRSGSTMLMRELARHKAIVVADLPPYEIKLLSYYASAFRTLVADEDRGRSTDPTTMFVDSDRFRIGHNPWNRPPYHALAKSGQLTQLFETIIPNRFAQVFRQNIADYYQILQHDHGKTDATYFAEKGDVYPDARDGARLFFPDVREIVLVRDPRDLLCSAIEFWKLAADEALEMLRTTLPMLDQIHREAGPDVMFVRYEDLIRAPLATRRALFRFVGIDTGGPLKGRDDEALRESHGTSSSADASVGRWRHALTEKSAAACIELFGAFIERFGYETGQVGRKQPAQMRVFIGETARSRVNDVSTISNGPTPPKLRLIGSWTFSAGGAGRTLLRYGWSKPEEQSVWSDGPAAGLTLPPVPGPGCYVLRLIAKPYTAGEALPQQRVSMHVNGSVVGEVLLDEFAVLECDLPHARGVDLPVQIELRLPDAARPCDVEPENIDERQLGIALEGVMVFSSMTDRDWSGPVIPQIADVADLLPKRPMRDFEGARADEAFATDALRTGTD